MVLGAITVLTVFLTELQEETSAELSAALAERDALKAEYYARSGVNLARLLIATEPTVRRTVQGIIPFIPRLPQIPVWEAADLVLGPFNDQAAGEAFAAMAGLDASEAKNMGLGGGGRFEVLVVDEDAKLNANTPARSDAISLQRFAQQFLGLVGGPQYNEMFEERDADGQFTDRQTICGAIVDWADAAPDGNEMLFPCDPFSGTAGVAGAEDNFYQLVGLNYRRKNTAFDSLDELRLVRGVSDEFWATFVDPEPQDPRRRVMTVWGQDKVNVNTAQALPLLAIICGNAVPGTPVCEDPLQLQQFLMGVNLLKNFLPPGVPLFGSTKDFIATLKGGGMFGSVLQTIGVQPVTFKSESELRKQIDTKSRMFSIYATGVVPGLRKELRLRIHAVVDLRNAPELGAAAAALGAGATGAGLLPPPPGSVRTGSVPRPDSPEALAAEAAAQAAANPNAILSALQVNPAGTIVYWRIE